VVFDQNYFEGLHANGQDRSQTWKVLDQALAMVHAEFFLTTQSKSVREKLIS